MQPQKHYNLAENYKGKPWSVKAQRALSSLMHVKIISTVAFVKAFHARCLQAVILQERTVVISE